MPATNTEAAARCGDTKEARNDAISLVRRLGQDAQVTRLDHIRQCRTLAERDHSFPRLAANHRLTGGSLSMARNAARDTIRPMTLSEVVCSIARSEVRTALKP
jgi:hypothetical protein